MADDAQRDAVGPADGPQWEAADLLAGWREAGVEPGMHVIVHSALSSIGRVRGGAATMVHSLGRAVGSEGTLVTPAFTPQVAHLALAPRPRHKRTATGTPFGLVDEIAPASHCPNLLRRPISDWVGP